ncbi:hypothetical protein [Castellaniella sp.]|uniref:hypothetical protein n=1 Tax=Castellaniella sp. TaxID=1955812 RepID=UPI0035632965
MSSAQNTHGGQETPLLGMYGIFMHWGSIIVPPGYSDPVIFASGGNPYGTCATMGEVSEAVLNSVHFQAQRRVRCARQ